MSEPTPNPPSGHYDLIAVGGGSGGLGAAGIARTFGLRTLLVEARVENIGGDCLNYGCVPSKALVHVSRLARAAADARAYGLEVGGRVDFAAALRHVHAAQDRIREHENADWLRARDHQDVAIGWARFTGEAELAVGDRRYTARRIVLATGSRPRRLDVPGVDELGERLHTNHSFFARERALPRRLLVVGGGAIACELGQAMARLGSEVTVVNRGDRLLARELPRYSATLQERLEREGVEVFHRAEVARFEGGDVAVCETLGRTWRVPFDECLVAIGRDASVRDMDLAVAGVAVDEHGVLRVDDRYRTTNPRVFAVGDAMGREMFSHGAELHNRDLIVNMLSPVERRHSLERFSWVTFTDPEVATFGLTAEQLTERGADFDTIEQPFAEDDRAIAGGYADEAHLTLYVEPRRLGGARILGGSMIAPHAGELIQELVLALHVGASVNDLFGKLYAYPVATRINQKAAFAYRQGGLGDGLKSAIRWWWRRGG